MDGTKPEDVHPVEQTRPERHAEGDHRDWNRGGDEDAAAVLEPEFVDEHALFHANPSEDEGDRQPENDEAQQAGVKYRDACVLIVQAGYVRGLRLHGKPIDIE